jgi:molybdopterin converting factor subunit 1
MQVRVLFFGVLKDIVGRAEETADVAPHSTLANVFEMYSERYETLRDKRPSILFARNREFSTPDALLSENDEIAFLPPVSGGAGGPSLSDFSHWIHDPGGHFFALTRNPIDGRALCDRLQRPEDGGVVIFEGVVRNNTKGRSTKYLEYECYEAMAIDQMAAIGREIASRFAISHIGFIHRLGHLEVGEASVAIVATAPHRGPAFQAALEGINRLKKEVPIWKKEFFVDGAVWVEGEWDERLRAGSNVESPS